MKWCSYLMGMTRQIILEPGNLSDLRKGVIWHSNPENKKKDCIFVQSFSCYAGTRCMLYKKINVLL